MRRTRNQKGFTIMELMIVIVIIGILIAIAVPAYKAFRDRAAAAACQSNLRTLKSAVGLYYADTGLVATDIARDLNPYMDNADTIHCPSKVAAGAYYTYSLDAAGVPVCDSGIAGHALP